jgi:hypothetical protein
MLIYRDPGAARFALAPGYLLIAPSALLPSYRAFGAATFLSRPSALLRPSYRAFGGAAATFLSRGL